MIRSSAQPFTRPTRRLRLKALFAVLRRASDSASPRRSAAQVYTYPSRISVCARIVPTHRAAHPRTSTPPAASIASFRLTVPRIRTRPSRPQRPSHRSDSPRPRLRARPSRILVCVRTVPTHRAAHPHTSKPHSALIAPSRLTVPRILTRPSRIQRPSRRSISQNCVSRPHTSEPHSAPLAPFQLTKLRLASSHVRAARSAPRAVLPHKLTHIQAAYQCALASSRLTAPRRSTGSASPRRAAAPRPSRSAQTRAGHMSPSVRARTRASTSPRRDQAAGGRRPAPM